MKKQVKSFVLGVIITTLLMNTAMGSSVKSKIEVVFNSVKLTINGKKVEADNILYNGTTYVPMRKVAEMLGKEVGWDAKTYTASINDVGFVDPWKDLPNITETGNAIIVTVPAMPELGFKWPYMLKIPTNTYKKQNSDATKRYLMFEMANTHLTKPNDMEVVVKERLEKLWTSTAWLAENTWSPVMMPLMPRTHSSYYAEENYKDQNYFHEHQLDRDIIMLDELMKDNRIKSEIEKSYEDNGYNVEDFLDYDKQVLAMIDHAIEYLNRYGHNVEDKIIIGGDSASGQFSNNFSTLYPERVKLSSGGVLTSGIMIPTAEYKGEQLIYPMGTYEYEQITGKKFSLEEHNKVARMFYYGKEDKNDALTPNDTNGDKERNLKMKLFGARLDSPNQWLKNANKAYVEVGGKGIMVYMDKTGHSVSNSMYDYLLQFYKENIRSEVPVYNMPKNSNGLDVEIYK